MLDTIDDYVEDALDETGDWEYLPANKAHIAYVRSYNFIDNAKTQVLMDKLPIRDLANTVRKIVADNGGKTALIRQLHEHYRDLLNEVKNDPSVKTWVKPVFTIVETLSMLAGNRKSVSAAAKRSKQRILTSTVDTLDRKGQAAAAKVSIKDEDEALGIVTIDPTNIVGAESAVIYNTKTRRLEVYRAAEGMRLSVKGSKIINLDEKTSIGKTIRKPEETLGHWTRATTLKRLDVLLKDITGKDWEVSGKFNKHTMLIKVL